MAPNRPLSRKELKDAVINLLAANSRLQNQLANAEGAITTINTDHSEIALFRNATKAQLKTAFDFPSMSEADKDRWEKVLKLLKAIVKEDLVDPA